MTTRHHTTVNIDPLLLEAAKKEGIKLSQTLDEAIRKKLYEKNPEVYVFENGWYQRMLENEIQKKKLEIEAQLHQLDQLKNTASHPPIKTLEPKTPRTDADLKVLAVDRDELKEIITRRTKEKTLKELDERWLKNRTKSINEKLEHPLKKEEYTQLVTEAIKNAEPKMEIQK